MGLILFKAFLGSSSQTKFLNNEDGYNRKKQRILFPSLKMSSGFSVASSVVAEKDLLFVEIGVTKTRY